MVTISGPDGTFKEVMRIRIELGGTAKVEGEGFEVSNPPLT